MTDDGGGREIAQDPGGHPRRAGWATPTRLETATVLPLAPSSTVRSQATPLEHLHAVQDAELRTAVDLRLARSPNEQELTGPGSSMA
jgi:hypothetical protein